MHASSEPVIDTPENPNDISISDAETQSGNEHEPSNDNDVEVEPAVDLDNPQSKNQRYDKRDFVETNQHSLHGIYVHGGLYPTHACT